MNPRPLGPENCGNLGIERNEGSFVDLNYMECIEFHKPYTICSHSLENQRTCLHEVKCARLSPPRVLRVFSTSLHLQSPSTFNVYRAICPRVGLLAFLFFLSVTFFSNSGWKCMAIRLYSWTTRSPIPRMCAQPRRACRRSRNGPSSSPSSLAGSRSLS